MDLNLQQFLLMILPLILAITLHEAAHAYAARHFGDRTAEQLGRLTLNPIAHIDPVGTILVPLVLFAGSMAAGGAGFLFGWAKPVPIITRNFKNVRTGMRMTALAGPLSNLAMMFAWTLIAVLVQFVPPQFQEAVSGMCRYGIMINAALFVLNMLPILPLDGGRVLDTFLPAKYSYQFNKIEPYGIWIVLILFVTGLLGKILFPAMLLLVLLCYMLIGGI
ncbi:MAG: site-2 protease family protein [Neisseriaceae bacterium]|nr:site-2 protease family protein [Neisseriaceae bacterium]